MKSQLLVGQKVCLVFPLKDTFFIFNNLIDLDRLSMLAISCMVEHWLFPMSQFNHYQLQLVYPTVEHHPARNLQHETSQTTFVNHLHFSCIFTFFEIIKSYYIYNMILVYIYIYMYIYIYQKCRLFPSICNIKMTIQKFSNFDKFFECILIWQLSQYNLTTLCKWS